MGCSLLAAVSSARLLPMIQSRSGTICAPGNNASHVSVQCICHIVVHTHGQSVLDGAGMVWDEARTIRQQPSGIDS